MISPNPNNDCRHAIDLCCLTLHGTQRKYGAFLKDYEHADFDHALDLALRFASPAIASEIRAGSLPISPVVVSELLA